VLGALVAVAQDAETSTEVPDYVIENEGCLKCHGEPKFNMYNSDSSLVFKKQMHHIINKELYYDSLAVHREFKCIDCHSDEFYDFPHSLDVRFEPPYTCMDCHEGDEDYIQFNFEGIADEYMASIHHTTYNDDFSCWKCHNPHGYILHARNDKNVKEIVKYNNNVCLSCHTNVDRFELISDHKTMDIISNHQWLPNQVAHFESVRCIDCHTKVSDTTLIAHEIQGKDKAVKNCVECHQQNSHLMASLYKFRLKENRMQNGFMNAVILTDSYVIGANRNLSLNKVSILIFIFTLGGILLHVILRVFTSKK
jgi:predicted CXXCH cytochrome family protein